MVYVGIDFSLNSTGVCIIKKGKFHWLNFAANVKYTNKPFYHHNLIKDFVSIENYERKVPKGSYVEEQQYKFDHAYYIANYITAAIEEIADGDEVKIAFEGFSYGSKGRSFIDLIAYNSTLKTILFCSNMTSITIYSPSEIKKTFSGKGNAGKDLMFDAFINLDNPVIKKDKVFNYCSSLKIIDGTIPKPFDDLIDAFAIVTNLRDSHIDSL